MFFQKLFVKHYGERGCVYLSIGTVSRQGCRRPSAPGTGLQRVSEGRYPCRGG